MSEKMPSVRLNMVMNALLTASSIVFPLISLPYVTRVLGPDHVGKVYFANSVVTTFAIFAELGIPVYGIRACAKVRDDREKLSETAQEILIINMVSCLAAYVLFGIALAAVPRFAQDRRLLILMSSLILLNALGAEWLYKAIERYTYITVRSVIFKVIALAGMFLLVTKKSDYVIYGGLTIFAAAASNVLNMINLRRHISLKKAGKYRFRRHLPAMFLLFALAAATSIYTNLDTAFLGFLKGDGQAGLYGVSVRIKLVVVSLITSVSAVLLPRASYYVELREERKFQELITKTAELVMMLAVPAVCYFAAFAPECIALLAGDKFSGAVLPMRIIMITVVFVGISNIAGMQVLVPEGRDFDVAIAAAAGAVIDLILNCLLIPRFASAGAAAATLAAEVIVTLYLVKKADALLNTGILRDVRWGRVTGLSLAAAVLSMTAKALHAGPFTTLLVAALIFAAVYAGGMIITEKYLKREKQ